MIKLSQTGYYALHAMIYIAKSKKSLVQIGDISQDEKISESLLRRIVADLEKAGILQSVRGRSGGVKLAREVQKISVYDILEAAGEELGIRDCTKGLYCGDKDDCSTTDVLSGIQRGFNSLLKMNTLDKLIR